MEAKEAPEKIWINPSMDLPKLNGVIDRDSVQYTRTDAFIEKACEYWYKYNRDVVNKRSREFTVNVEDFKKYMEE